MRKKFTIYHILFCIFLTGGSLTFSQEDTISTKHKPIRNPIIDYNNNLKDIFKEESLRQVNLTGAPVSVVEADGSVKYLEEKTLMILSPIFLHNSIHGD